MAEAELLKTLADKPSSGTAHVRLAILYATLGNLDQALASVQRAYKVDPLLPTLPSANGNVHVWRGEFDQAIAIGSSAIELHPYLQISRSNYAQALEFSGRLQEALVQYQLGSMMAGDLPWMRALEGTCLAKLDRIPEARAILDELEHRRATEYCDALYREPAHTKRAVGARSVDEEPSVGREDRLEDRTAGQGVLPEHRAIGRRDAGGPRFAGQHNLLDAVDRQALRRAVAAAAARRVTRTDPSRLARGQVVGGQGAGRADDDEVERILEHEGRARDAPCRDLRVEVGNDIARPDKGAAPGVHRVQDAGDPEGVDRPLLMVGVPRGPAPPFDSQNRTASRWLQAGAPVEML